MKAILLLLAVTALFTYFSYAAPQNDGLRLIEFNTTYRVWMNESQVQGLIECVPDVSNERRTFMDITDHQDLSVGASTRANPPIPTTPTHQAIFEKFVPELSQDNLRELIRTFSAYKTRYYTSPESELSAKWLANQYKVYSAGRSDISVSLFPHSWLQPSVIARIAGNGPNANEVVIIGGHIDSTSSSSAAPGADDDASGSMTVLEIFRVVALLGFRPSRTLEFQGYAAEEVGLRGSQDIAAKYAKDKVIVASMMQLDMTGYYKPATTPIISLTSDFTSKELNTFVAKLADAYTTLKAVENPCGYGCSDHASFYKAGYLSCHPFEAAMKNTSPFIHTSSDLLVNLNLEHAMEFARLGLGYVIELSF